MNALKQKMRLCSCKLAFVNFTGPLRVQHSCENKNPGFGVPTEHRHERREPTHVFARRWVHVAPRLAAPRTETVRVWPNLVAFPRAGAVATLVTLAVTVVPSSTVGAIFRRKPFL